jgi:hypothetical protein
MERASLGDRWALGSRHPNGFRRHRASLLTLAVSFLLMLGMTGAFADNVVNDVVAGGNDTIASGGTTTIAYKINAAMAGDTQPGCNPADGSSATVTLSVPALVTASQTSLVFSACTPSSISVTFGSSTPGDYAINVTSVSDSGAGSYNNQANWTLHVTGVTPPVDTTPPVITPNVTGTLGNNLWYTSNVLVSWTVADGESAISSSSGCGSTTISTDTAGTTLTCSATSAGGTSSESVTIKRDATDPTNVAFTDGSITDGGSYYFGFVPTGPTTCTADDATSLLADCSVTGGGTSVGGHSYTATATDNAGNDATATLSYTVLAWTLNGFYAPVDRPDTLNITKGGSTVPLKFEVFAGTTELTDTSIVSAFTQKIACAAGTGDAIEEYSTGATSLRYDTTAGQFVFNWKTLKAPGSCYRVTMVTEDGSSIYANFNLK